MQQESNTRYLGRWWQGGLRERKLLQHYLRMNLVVESNFDFPCLFHGHGTDHRMGGRRAVSEIVFNFLDMYFFVATY